MKISQNIDNNKNNIKKLEHFIDDNNLQSNINIEQKAEIDSHNQKLDLNVIPKLKIYNIVSNEKEKNINDNINEESENGYENKILKKEGKNIDKAHDHNKHKNKDNNKVINKDQNKEHSKDNNKDKNKDNNKENNINKNQEKNYLKMIENLENRIKEINNFYSKKISNLNIDIKEKDNNIQSLSNSNNILRHSLELLTLRCDKILYNSRNNNVLNNFKKMQHSKSTNNLSLEKQLKIKEKEIKNQQKLIKILTNDNKNIKSVIERYNLVDVNINLNDKLHEKEV